jgi:hypothetical protein
VIEFGGTGAAVVVDSRAIVDPGQAPGNGLGAALAWSRNNGADDLDLFVESDSGRDVGALARQAGRFARPPRVWQIDGTTVTEADPTTLDPPLVPPPSTAEQVLLLEQAGVEVVIEGGVVLGEVLGLEIAQVAVAEDGTAMLEVGVGRFDREAFALIHGELSPPAALARALAEVRSFRAPGVAPHPINRLARERWLRCQVMTDPALVGASELHPVEATRPREGLRDVAIAVALGTRIDGAPLVVVTSVGVDVDLVPDAADARAWHAPDADLVLVVPTGDAHPVTRLLASQLASPADLMEVAPEWSR